MRSTLLALLTLATLAHSADVARIVNGTDVERRTLPCGIGNASISVPGRLPDEALAEGWRDVVATNVANVKAAHWTDTGSQWVYVVDATYTPAELAQQAADAATAQAIAESNRLATPIKYDQPIQARLETPADDGHVYGLEIDPDSGELYSVQRESVRKSDAEYAVAKAVVKGKRNTAKTDMQALKTAIQAIDPSAFPAGTQRQTIKAIVDALKELRRIEAKE